MGKSDDLQKMRSAIEQGGGADKIKQQHDDGKRLREREWQCFLTKEALSNLTLS